MQGNETLESGQPGERQGAEFRRQLGATPLGLSFEPGPAIRPEDRAAAGDLAFILDNFTVEGLESASGIGNARGGLVIRANGARVGLLASFIATRPAGEGPEVFWFWSVGPEFADSATWEPLASYYGIPERHRYPTVTPYPSATAALSSFLTWAQENVPAAVVDTETIPDPESWACWGTHLLGCRELHARELAEAQAERETFRQELVAAVVPPRRKRVKA